MKHFVHEQAIPLAITVVTFFILCALLFGTISLLNFFPASEKIHPLLRYQDILIGLTIYLKTSIDFAIFIGNLMHANPGWKKRISIEIGTASGNAFGTMVILTLWNFFREVPLLMAIMIIVASLVLLRMAQESLEEFLRYKKLRSQTIHQSISFLEQQLEFFNRLFKPFWGKLLPETGITTTKSLSFWNLAWFSFTIPFILGLDDFAGYIPLFNVINVFGFSVGVFLGHMLLNVALFVSPQKTTKIVRHPLVLIIGGLAFVGIALWGFYESFHLLQTIFFH